MILISSPILSSCNKSHLSPPSPSITELFREKRKSRNSISMELFCFLLGGLDYIVTVASPTNGDLRVSLMMTPLFPRFTTFFFLNSLLVLLNNNCTRFFRNHDWIVCVTNYSKEYPLGIFLRVWKYFQGTITRNYEYKRISCRNIFYLHAM